MNIVCIHGIAGSKAYFDPLKEFLEKQGMRVLCFDLPGFGSRKFDLVPRTLTEYDAFLDSQITPFARGEKVVLIAHSGGGVIASRWASTRPQKVEKLVLLNVPVAETAEEFIHGTYEHRTSWEYVLLHAPRLSRLACTILCQKGYMKIFRHWKPHYIPDKVFADYTQHTFDSLDATFKLLLIHTPLLPLLKSVHVPTLRLFGTAESMVFIKSLSLPNVTSVAIPGNHHILHERFSEVSEYILNFLS